MRGRCCTLESTLFRAGYGLSLNDEGRLRPVFVFLTVSDISKIIVANDQLVAGMTMVIANMHCGDDIGL